MLFLDELAIRVESPDADLVAAGLLDSAAIVRLLVEIEHKFGVTLPVAELGIESFRSVAQMASMVEQLKKQQEAHPPASTKPAYGSREEVMKAVAALLLETQSLRVESDTTDLFKAGQLDSMALVQLIVDMESHFGVTLPMEELELESFRSISSMAGVILSRMS
jgi:acyl carrier protein